MTEPMITNKDLEKEANVFALLLLMPKQILLQEIESAKLDMGGGKVADKKYKALLEKFGVSSTALAARLSLMKKYGV